MARASSEMSEDNLQIAPCGFTFPLLGTQTFILQSGHLGMLPLLLRIRSAHNRFVQFSVVEVYTDELL